MNTRNQSFIEMHKYLEAIGIKNNKYMLTLLDKDLAEVIASDPEVMESLESISLVDERSAKTIISIIDHKLAWLKSKK